MLNSFVFFFDSPAKTLNRVVRYEYFGYPRDFLAETARAIDSVTRADVLRVAKEHFIPENLTIVAVGNPKEFGKPLTSLGPVKTIDLTIPEPKQEVAKPDAAGMAKGRELLERARQAMGGTEKLAAIKDRAQTAEVTMQGVKIKGQSRFIAPAYIREDQEYPFGKVNRLHGWQDGMDADSPGKHGHARAIIEAGARRNIPGSFARDSGRSRRVYSGERDFRRRGGDFVSRRS